MVALVATLAALAALGRIAFAALPNVKPSTDIVLISGYALGGAPGFVVGALTGLVSNFFFGQGPWTPWQMAAWGAAGLIGAGLATVTGRRIGRWPLAIVCAIVGYAFTAFQDFGDWVTYSDHSLAQLGVYVGRGTGFDLVHAAACLVFALAFGPALARSLERFTIRLDVVWRSPAVPVALAAVALGALAAAPVTRAAATPGDYLRAAQNADGGFGPAPGQSSSALYSGWAALGLAALGIDPAGASHGGPSLLAYVSANPGGSDPGSLERTILAVRSGGAPAPSALLSGLERAVGADGSVSDQVNLTAFGVLALRAAGAPLPPATLGWLLRQQDRDGGFSFATAGGGSDVDDTAAALEALGAAGAGRGSAAARAAAYIRSRQNRDGGFPTEGATGSNAQSTAWAIQGLIAAGVDPASVRRAGRSRPAAVPRFADRARRPRPLRARSGSDAGVGHGRGGDGPGRQAAAVGRSPRGGAAVEPARRALTSARPPDGRRGDPGRRPPIRRPPPQRRGGSGRRPAGARGRRRSGHGAAARAARKLRNRLASPPP